MKIKTRSLLADPKIGSSIDSTWLLYIKTYFIGYITCYLG